MVFPGFACLGVMRLTRHRVRILEPHPGKLHCTLHKNSSITLSFPIIVTPQINISEYIQVHDLPCSEGN
jgi:hypothetical protein